MIDLFEMDEKLFIVKPLRNKWVVRMFVIHPSEIFVVAKPTFIVFIRKKKNFCKLSEGKLFYPFRFFEKPLTPLRMFYQKR